MARSNCAPATSRARACSPSPELDKALDAAIAVADDGYKQRISSATAITDWLPLISGGALAATLLLAAGGLWLRFQEYR
ncbi:MAG: hypothetical protein WDN69_35355 [Aliidongia sp.]